MRTRLVWFTVGFSVSGAAIAQFVGRDLWTERMALSSHMKHKMDSLEARISNLESITAQNSTAGSEEEKKGAVPRSRDEEASVSLEEDIQSDQSAME